MRTATAAVIGLTVGIAATAFFLWPSQPNANTEPAAPAPITSPELHHSPKGHTPPESADEFAERYQKYCSQAFTATDGGKLYREVLSLWYKNEDQAGRVPNAWKIENQDEIRYLTHE